MFSHYLSLVGLSGRCPCLAVGGMEKLPGIVGVKYIVFGRVSVKRVVLLLATNSRPID